MDNWLKNRLSPVKIDTPRWQEFAEAIEQFWEENFDPDSEWLVSLRSIYETDLTGQLLIQSKKGEYFEDDIPSENIPLAVQQKELELCQKGTIFPFQNTLLRLGLTAEWVPLYAERVKAYGTDFKQAGNVPQGWQLDGSWHVDEEAEGKLRAGYFLTSRGILKVSLGDESIAEEIQAIRDRMTQTRPVWIVFDGIVYNIETELEQDHELEASGSLHAESKLPGWADCGLKLDGTWGLGRVIRLDGEWCLGQGWKLGQIWPRGIIVNELDGSKAVDGSWTLSRSFLPHFKISECKIKTDGALRAIDEIPPWRPIGNYFQVTDDMPIGLDGDYQLGRTYEGLWPQVQNVNPITTVYPWDLYDLIDGGSSGDLPLDVAGGLASGDIDTWTPERTLFGGDATV